MTECTRVALVCLLLLAAAPAAAQDRGEDPKELRRKRDAKLKEAWLQASPWTTSYDEARARAEKSGKLIFAYFTRSYRA
ncbi:MAG: hypothetical protein ACYTDY_05435 [Planctomycetota bacterium]|jgi:hypothetical protein